ncbi:G-protein coupled receptor 143-like [Chrysoperla carnea]|uniref:G-protein coupled receptor 143-like n=1 Tax=Chrysoperla carnea TaxID=189513 RepID=UPI001D076153|nr:G-protein coupled receptor 143-like [Chrysoperla carnea]
MADPTIQTFCCRRTNETSIMGDQILDSFNTDAYNIVCIVSSTIGVCGALYQILPREERRFSHRWLSSTTNRGRQIIVYLAIADLLASLGVLIRSSLWLEFRSRLMPGDDDTTNVVFCAIFSAWTQYFYMATWIWTLCYAIDMRLILKEKEGYPQYYHLAAWTIPAVLTFLGLSLLYFPDAKCHSYQSLKLALIKVLPNYLATYIPITAIMITNPILYKYSSQDMENVVHRSLGQITSKERDVIDAIKMKFFLINAAFYVCWAPNLISGFLLWTLWWHLPVGFLIGIWYIMAVTNPLQALFNSFVYRRWSTGTERVYIPWRKIQEDSLRKFSLSQNGSKVSSAREELPLLQSYPKNSINVYSSVQN